MAVPVACILETPRESGTVLPPLKNQPTLIAQRAHARGSRRVCRLDGGVGGDMATALWEGAEGEGISGGADVTGGSMCGCKIFGHHML